MSLPTKPPGLSPTTVDMARVFRDRERFLSRFLWHIILEPPLSQQRRGRAGGQGKPPETDLSDKDSGSC
jgi:hypothetical protein